MAQISLGVTRICVVRHGETTWNQARRLQGHFDIPLNPKGLEQAHAVGRYLANEHPEVTRIYSSDLKRAWETASVIGQSVLVTPQSCPAFRERAYGEFEGMTHAEVQAQHPDLYWQIFEQREELAAPPGGESLRVFFDRITNAFLDLAAGHMGESVVLVCHGGVLDAINRFVRRRLLNLPRDFEVPNAGVNWITFNPEHDFPWALEVWGDTRHLVSDTLDELPG